MADDPKPRGWGKFDALARGLVAVPPDAIEKVIAQKKAKRKKRRKPKK